MDHNLALVVDQPRPSKQHQCSGAALVLEQPLRIEQPQRSSGAALGMFFS